MKNPKPMNNFVKALLVLLPMFIAVGFYYPSLTPKHIKEFLENLENRIYDFHIVNSIADERALSALQKEIQKEVPKEVSKEVPKNDFTSDKKFQKIFDETVAKSKASKDIVIIGIDEKTLNELDQWPIRRDHYGKLLSRCLEDGRAAGFVFDVVFAEKGDPGLKDRLKQLKDESEPQYAKKLEQLIADINYDSVLIDAIKKHKYKIVGGYATLSPAEAAIKDFTQTYLPTHLEKYEHFHFKKFFHLLPQALGGTYNYPDLRYNLAFRGYFTFPYGTDGILRNTALLTVIPTKRMENSEYIAIMQNNGMEFQIEQEINHEGTKYSILEASPMVFGALALEAYFMSTASPLGLREPPLATLQREGEEGYEKEWLLLSEDKHRARKALNKKGQKQIQQTLLAACQKLPNNYSFLQKELLSAVINKQKFRLDGTFAYVITVLNLYAENKLANKSSLAEWFLEREEPDYRRLFLQGLTPESADNIIHRFSREQVENISIEERQSLLEQEIGHLDCNIVADLLKVVHKAFSFILKNEIQILYSFTNAQDEKAVQELLDLALQEPNFIANHFNDNLTDNFIAQVRMNRFANAGINFTAGAKSYIQYSMIDILTKDRFHGQLFDLPTPEISLQEALEDKIIFFGPTALGINDWRVTPVAQQMDGVESHAHLFDTLRHNSSIFRTNDIVLLEQILFIIMAFALPFFIRRLNASYGALLTFFTLFAIVRLSTLYLKGETAPLPHNLMTVLTIIGTIAILYYLKRKKCRKTAYAITILLAFGLISAFSQLEGYRIYFQIIPFFLLFISQYTLLTTYEFVLEEKERKKTRNAFQNYVNASVVNAVLSDPEMLKLGGQKREMTCLFSDVRGFTTISEKLEPQVLVSLMNEYLEEMTDLVMLYNGTLDKFIGDAVMAFWGAPIVQKNHAELAAITAIEMNKRVAILYGLLLEKYGVEVRIGIGLNTGPMVVGNMGSSTRFNYTVLGDAVNLGARLESQTKNYGAELIVSQSTYDHIKDWSATRFLDLIAVKGKAEPVRIYECIGYKKEMSEEVLNGLAEFELAIKRYYLGREFEEGIRVFESLKRYRNGKDVACDLYINRCRNFLENPPNDEWNGVFVATSK